MVSTIIEGIKRFDLSIGQPDARKTIFRINRDLRFSSDKSPYKTNFGSYIHPGNKQTALSYAGYYIHLEPGGKSFLAGGAYMPPPEWMKAIRDKIYFSEKGFTKITGDKNFSSLFRLESEQLKRDPKEYDAGFAHIEFLKFKNIYAEYHVTDKLVASGNFSTICLRAFKTLHPFNRFLNDAFPASSDQIKALKRQK